MARAARFKRSATVGTVTPARSSTNAEANSVDARRAPSSVLVMVVAVLAGVAIGIATSIGQGALPDAVLPLSNSSGSWCLCAFALALQERDPRRAALVGFAALAAMLAGYAVATELRGYPVATSMFVRWGAAAVIAGPALGIGAAWLRGTQPERAAAGVAPIAGILLGEAVYGLTVVAGTTSVAYWIGELVVGLGVVALAARRLRSGRGVALMLALTAVATGVFYLVCTLVLGAVF
jgi:hypothetical protein